MIWRGRCKTVQLQVLTAINRPEKIEKSEVAMKVSLKLTCKIVKMRSHVA